MRVGRIPYVNCYPVYRGIDRGDVELHARLVTGVPTALNTMMAEGSLDISVVSAVEYARRPDRYYLLPDLAISCDGPVRSVLLLSRRPATDLDGTRVIVSRSSMTSVALLRLLFADVWRCDPVFVAGDAEVGDITRFGSEAHDARLIIGDAALLVGADARGPRSVSPYAYAYDLGAEWKRWTGQPFVFAVWLAQRTVPVAAAARLHAGLLASRDWGIRHLDVLAQEASAATGVPALACEEYMSGLDYGLTDAHLGGLQEFFRRLESAGQVAHAPLSFLPAA